jgi:hypothetical protein
VWGDLPGSSRLRLLEEGVPHLLDQVRAGSTRLILLNGRQVIDQVEAVGLVKLSPIGRIEVRSVKGTLVEGQREGVRYLGWSTNIQSSRGVTLEFRRQVAAWLATCVQSPGGSEERAMAHAAIRPDGYIEDTRVRGKAEFHQLLSDWLRVADARTIGDGGTYSRRASIIAELESGHEIRLNSDTKRDAVAEYVDYAARHGVSTPWSVVANRNGKRNKVTYRADGAVSRGWYCYVHGNAELSGSL